MKKETMYIAFDGTRFINEKECKAYEAVNSIQTLNCKDLIKQTNIYNPLDCSSDFVVATYLCKNEHDKQILLDYLLSIYYFDEFHNINIDDITIGWNVVVDTGADYWGHPICSVLSAKAYAGYLMKALESVMGVM